MTHCELRVLAAALTAACISFGQAAQASNGMQLADDKLDRITAAGVFVSSDVTAQAIGQYLSSAVGLSNTITGMSQGVQPGFDSEGGLASGTAVTFGFNGANTSAAPPSTSSNVATGGVVDGNFKVTVAGGGTVSALGLTIQGAFTSVYGVWVPGL